MGFQNVRLIQNIEETCVKCQNACVGGWFWWVGRVGSDSKGELWVFENNTRVSENDTTQIILAVQTQYLGIHKQHYQVRVSNGCYSQTTQGYPSTDNARVSMNNIVVSTNNTIVSSENNTSISTNNTRMFKAITTPGYPKVTLNRVSLNNTSISIQSTKTNTNNNMELVDELVIFPRLT